MYAALVFLWLRLEDSDALPAALAGWGAGLLLMASWGGRAFGGRVLTRRLLVVVMALLGAGAGVCAGVTTSLLMLIKNGLHAHLFPDYPFSMVAGVLMRAPVWGAAGALFGVGAALLWSAFAGFQRVE